MRHRTLVIASTVLLLAGLLAGGCGGGVESPTTTANKFISAYRANNPAGGRSCFMNPGMYDALVQEIPDGATLRAGNELMQDPSNATVDVLFGQTVDTNGWTLVMGNSGSGWKVVNFMAKGI